MKQSGNNLLIGILIFTIGFLTAALVQFYPETKILIRIAFVFSMIYLALGWYTIPDYRSHLYLQPGYGIKNDSG